MPSTSACRTASPDGCRWRDADAAGRRDVSAQSLAAQALDELGRLDHDPLLPAVQALRGVQAQLADASHTLGLSAQGRPRPRPPAELDERVSAWLQLARRYRRPPAELPALLAQWRAELAAHDAAVRPGALQAQPSAARASRLDAEAAAAHAPAPPGSAAPGAGRRGDQAMQQLGMAGGASRCLEPRSRTAQSWGLEGAEFWWPAMPAARRARWPRWPPAASCRASRWPSPSPPPSPPPGRADPDLDEIDAGGVGGAGGRDRRPADETVGRTAGRQVLAVTHPAAGGGLRRPPPSSSPSGWRGATVSQVRAVAGEGRVTEIAHAGRRAPLVHQSRPRRRNARQPGPRGPSGTKR